MLPDFRSRVIIEELVDAEVAQQFEMSPMVEGIAETVRDRGSPGEEFVAGGSVTGTERFRDTVGAHGAPFVVIAFQPDLAEVAELAIGGDVGGGKMGMEIENGLESGKFVVEMASGGVVEEKIVVDKGHSALARRER